MTLRAEKSGRSSGSSDQQRVIMSMISSSAASGSTVGRRGLDVVPEVDVEDAIAVVVVGATATTPPAPAPLPAEALPEDGLERFTPSIMSANGYE